jgi:hypothetical protein
MLVGLAAAPAGDVHRRGRFHGPDDVEGWDGDLALAERILHTLDLAEVTSR